MRRNDSNPRRLWIHERLSPRKILARFETLHDWRRHFRDSANHYRARSHEAGMKVSFVDCIFAGDTNAVARAISKVEDDPGEAADLMKQVFARTGRALIIGITGAPGAGKSSLVDKLAAFYRAKGHGLGII